MLFAINDKMWVAAGVWEWGGQYLRVSRMKHFGRGFYDNQIEGTMQACCWLAANHGIYEGR